MKKIILVSGGARSGKSNYAQERAGQAGDAVLYIATAVCTDAEMADRIRHHQANRPATWGTHEGFRDLGPVLTQANGHYQAILVDCLTMMTNNLLFADWQDDLSMEEINSREQEILSQLDQLLTTEFDGELILVTNELGLGLVPAYPLGRAFRDIAGRVNQKAAAAADEFYFLFSGVPLRLK